MLLSGECGLRWRSRGQPGPGGRAAQSSGKGRDRERERGRKGGGSRKKRRDWVEGGDDPEKRRGRRKGKEIFIPFFPPFSFSFSLLPILFFCCPNSSRHPPLSPSLGRVSPPRSAREAEGDGRRREGEGGSSLVASNEKVMRGIRPSIFHVGEQNKDRLYFLQQRKTIKLQYEVCKFGEFLSLVRCLGGQN